MSQSENLSLPYILPSQAQKHVTHNEAIRALDALVHIYVVSRSVVSPPAQPDAGARYLVPDQPTGIFSDKAGFIAAFQDGAFEFYTPQTGFIIYVEDELSWVYYDGTNWTALPGSETVKTFSQLGVSATPDSINKFALSSEAALFTHAGSNHRLNLNKASQSDTVTLVFQTNYSGRAEFGLAGDDHFRIKTSADGTSFTNAITADTSSGYVSIGDVFPSAQFSVANHMNIVDSASTDSLSLASSSNTAVLDTSNDEIQLQLSGHEKIGISNDVIRLDNPLKLADYSENSLPNILPEGQIIYVSDATGGACLAFSDGINWRRSNDLSIIT